jgi:hypothetical protein
MKTISGTIVRVLSAVALLIGLSSSQALAKDPPKKATSDAPMHLHHMHTMMNHGLIMALQGSNLVMLSEMKMAPGVDEITLSHGKKMITDGKAMLKEMLGGEHMTAMHKGGQATLNHALEMAAEGSNLVMMGQMKMAKGVDKHTVDHGKQMIADGFKLWNEVMGGSAMADMHKAGTTPEGSVMMWATHKLAGDQKKVLDLLANMQALK